ncbi:MAG: hypothetical protein GY816_19890 [Cytophagales bacterium]|nr:hypothetical protein [Cytophagales bacterium]
MKTILFSAIILLLACSSSKSEKNNVILNLNEKALSEKRVSFPAGMGFRFPKDWITFTRSEILGIDSTIYSNSNNQEIMGGAQDPNSESFLVYLANSNFGLAKDSVDFKNGIWLGLQYSEFLHNEIAFKQTVLQNKEIVLFKIFIENEGYSIHYFVNRKNITFEALAIESSIASIKKQ